MSKIFIKKDRERMWQSGHPWMYSGAVEKIEGNPEAGSVIEVYNWKKEFIGYGHYNKNSKIMVRMLEKDVNKKIDLNWYSEKVKEAYALREMININSNGYRLIHSESDSLPGVIVDRFGDYLVVQASTLGMEKDKELLIEALKKEIPNLKGIYEKSEGDGRKLEGLPEVSGVLFGEVPDEIEIFEGEAKFTIDLKGQKT